MKQNFFSKYFSIRVLPIWIILLIDVCMVACSCLAAFVLRYSLHTVGENLGQVLVVTGLAVAINIIFFRVFRTYSNVIRFSSFVDIFRLLLALSLAYGTLAVVSYFAFRLYEVDLGRVSLLAIAFFVNAALMIASRIVVKTVFERLSVDFNNRVNVFIYGAQEAGVNIAKSIRNDARRCYKLRGFIADEPDLVGKTIMGVPIYANDSKLIQILAEREVDTLIVSPAKMDKLKKDHLAEYLLDNNIKLLTAPPLNEWSGDKLQTSQIKKIEIEDLLQREPIQVDLKKIASHLEGKRVMITGAAGSIGSEIMRQVAQFNPYELILVDQAETPLHDIRLELLDKWRNLSAVTIVADITNLKRMEAIFEEHKPQYIFHAAAYKHVPMMEDNVSEAIQVNVGGTRNIANLAVKYKAEKFVMVSTDKAVNPTNVMGCSKRLAEIYVQSLAKKIKENGDHSVSFITTRFGNVLGSNGSVIPRFRAQIEKGGPVTVTHPEIIRYFMTIPEACRLVLEAGSMGHGGEIYIFDMGEPVKILDLAKRMISLSGRGDVKITFTGLRHGEKLYEELLNTKELTKPTYHEKIMIANVREYDFEEVNEKIEELIALSYTFDEMKIVGGMKAIVPEFISKNSCFEKLDK